MRYLEYEVSTGRIISEVISSSELEPTSTRGYFLVGDNEEIDLTQYAIRNGALVKVGETNQERLERERIRREHGEQCRRRVRSMSQEFLIALLAEDEEEIANLRREYRKMKAYI